MYFSAIKFKLLGSGLSSGGLQSHTTVVRLGLRQLGYVVYKTGKILQFGGSSVVLAAFTQTTRSEHIQSRPNGVQLPKHFSRTATICISAESTE